MPTVYEIENLSGIGFRHMLEDGVAIVTGGAKLPDERRQYVLHDLTNLFDEAYRGSHVFQQEPYHFDPADSTDLSSFTFVERYLSEREPVLISQNVESVRNVLSAMRAGETVDQAEGQIAGDILCEMLKSLELRGGIGLAEEPAHLGWDE